MPTSGGRGADIKKGGRRAVAIPADVGKPEDIVRLFKTVDAELGRLDAFFNNAGIVEQASKFVDIAPERLQRILAVNTVGAFIAAQEAVRRMSTSTTPTDGSNACGRRPRGCGPTWPLRPRR